MLRVVVIVIELSFEVEKEEGGGGRVDWFTINPSDKSERNLVHLLPLLPIPVVPILPQRCSLPAISLDFFYPFLRIDIHSFLFHNASTPISIACTASLPLPPSPSPRVSVSDVPVINIPKPGPSPVRHCRCSGLLTTPGCYLCHTIVIIISILALPQIGFRWRFWRGAYLLPPSPSAADPLLLIILFLCVYTPYPPNLFLPCLSHTFAGNIAPPPGPPCICKYRKRCMRTSRKIPGGRGDNPVRRWQTRAWCIWPKSPQPLDPRIRTVLPALKLLLSSPSVSSRSAPALLPRHPLPCRSYSSSSSTSLFLIILLTVSPPPLVVVRWIQIRQIGFLIDPGIPTLALSVTIITPMPSSSDYIYYP